MTDKQTEMIGRLAAIAMTCLLAGACMYLTNGETGIGWGILGLGLVWACW
jgi:hypothetical protein